MVHLSREGRRWTPSIHMADAVIDGPLFETKRKAQEWALTIVVADRDLRKQGRALLAQALGGTDASVS